MLMMVLYALFVQFRPSSRMLGVKKISFGLFSISTFVRIKEKIKTKKLNKTKKHAF